MKCFLDFMHAWSDVWVFLTAAGTIALAFATYAVIKQGQRLRADAEAQHRERLRPVCLLVPYNGADSLEGRGALIRLGRSAHLSHGIVLIRCQLRNVGVGPALNIRLRFRFLDMQGWTSEPWDVAPLQAGEHRGAAEVPLEVPFRLPQERFNSTDFGQIPDKGWQILLEYEDMFGSKFLTAHHKSPITPDLTNPKPQAWATFEDVK